MEKPPLLQLFAKNWLQYGVPNYQFGVMGGRVSKSMMVFHLPCSGNFSSLIFIGGLKSMK